MICRDFNCPGSGVCNIDSQLMNTQTSYNLVQPIAKPTPRDGNTLDLFVSINGSDVISAVDVIDPSVFDHFLLTTTLSCPGPTWCPTSTEPPVVSTLTSLQPVSDKLILHESSWRCGLIFWTTQLNGRCSRFDGAIKNMHEV